MLFHNVYSIGFVLFLVIVFLLCICECCNPIRENITMQTRVVDFKEISREQDGPVVEWGTYGNDYNSEAKKFFVQSKEKYKGTCLPLKDGDLNFFRKNVFKPECCAELGGAYSKGIGCACLSESQKKFLLTRGNNGSVSEIN